MSELSLDREDGMPDACVATFDSLHTVRRSQFRRRITRLSQAKMNEACRILSNALGCR